MSEKVYVDKGLSSYFMNIYQYVGINLMLAGSIAFFVSSNNTLFNLIIGTPLFYAIIFAPVLVGMYVTANLEYLSVGAVQAFYWFYGASIGASLSSIFIIYSAESIFRCFLMSGVVFVAAALYGRLTSKDLSSMRSILMIGLIGILITSFINFFMCSAFLQYILSWAIIGIFTAFIAFDMQQLQNIYFTNQSSENIEKISILGSLHLFMSFINIFIAMLELFGDRRKK